MITYWVPVLNMGTLKVLKERQYSRNQIDNVTTPKSGPFAIFSHPSPNINMFLREIFQVVFDTCLILAFFFFFFWVPVSLVNREFIFCTRSTVIPTSKVKGLNDLIQEI